MSLQRTCDLYILWLNHINDITKNMNICASHGLYDNAQIFMLPLF